MIIASHVERGGQIPQFFGDAEPTQGAIQPLRVKRREQRGDIENRSARCVRGS
jgi:hypothetical protein